jgi:hypothetical protein
MQNTGYDQGGVLYFQVATLLSHLDDIQPTGLVPTQVLAQVGNYVCPMHTAALIIPVPFPIDHNSARKQFTFRERQLGFHLVGHFVSVTYNVKYEVSGKRDTKTET